MKIKIFILFSAFLFSQSFFENHPGILLSGKYSKQENSFSGLLGFNYEYRFEKSKPVTGFGLNSTVEIGDQIELNVGPALYFHPVFDLVLSVSPMYSLTQYPENDGTLDIIDQNQKTGTQHNFILRFMAMYNFPIGVIDLSPTLGIDIVSENYEAFVGVNITLPIDFKIRI